MPGNRLSTSRRANGFTLIELLVVIGIIVLILGLLIPAVLKSYQSGVRARTQADLALIGTALNAYRQDFGDYPRFDDDNTGLNLSNDRGAILLCRALIAPGSQAVDGDNGTGFRIRGGGQGKVYGPYLQADKYKLGGSDQINFSDATILDHNNHPILYYPAATGHPNIEAANGFVVSVAPLGNGVPQPRRPLYNAYDNTASPTGTLLSVKEMQVILGDRNTNGRIDGTESAVYTGPYLLWTAGEDDLYGRDPTTGKSDDVTNFDIPADLRQ